MQAPPYWQVPAWQSAVLILASLVVLWVSGSVAAMSLLAGGLINVIPQLFFVYRLSIKTRRQQFARAGYSAEVGKFLLSAAGFALVFSTLRPIDAGAVFLGFCLMIPIQIICSWRLLRRPQ